MEQPSGYPIGQQDFKTLRDMNCIFVDKTNFIEKLIISKAQYYFLARPRRFGKSLFLSTLRYFFEGEKRLFKGLHIDSMDWDWAEYPVLHLDLNTERYATTDKLSDVLLDLFGKWEKKYGIEGMGNTNPPQRFKNIIETAYAKTGRQVVILVDEYDKPLVNNLNRPEQFDHYREDLAAVYSNFKTCAECIRLVFITGVSRFSKLTVFSGLNNLKDITFTDEYADICGITSDELLEYFKPGIEEIAKRYKVGFNEMLIKLKNAYDGYRFSGEGSDIYNPWSLLNCLNDKYISYYWNETGIPTIVAETLKKLDIDLQELFDDTACTLQDLQGMDITTPNPVALMYQTGYLTIKDFHFNSGTYLLGVPNEEVRDGLVKVLIPYYVDLKNTKDPSLINNLITRLNLGQPQKFMTAIQAYFAGITYKLKMDNENNFHNAFFLLTSLIGLNTQAEFSTSDGSIDMLIRTDSYTYVIELKYDGTAQAALQQIDSKEYALPFTADHRKIFKIGVNFSSEKRRIIDWIIE